MSIISSRAGVNCKPLPVAPKPIETYFVDRPGTPTGMMIGLDLGQSRDWSAVVLIQRVEGERIEYRRWTPYEPEATEYARRQLIMHNVLRLHRYPLGTSYVEIAHSIRGVMQQLATFRDQPELIVDAGGVGRAVVDQLRDFGLKPFAMTITGGLAATTKSQEARVAKKQLASTLDVVLSERRLQVPAADQFAGTLVEELRNFTLKVTAAGNETFAALDKVGLHDDLVMACAIAVWRGENRPQPMRWENVGWRMQV